MSACPRSSSRVMEQRRHDSSRAVRFNPSGSNGGGTEQQPPSHHHHPDDSILSRAASHSPHHKTQLICRTHTSHPVPSAPPSTTRDVHHSLCDAQLGLSFRGLFFSVCLAWRQAFCLSECLLKPLMLYLSASWGHRWEESVACLLH